MKKKFVLATTAAIFAFANSAMATVTTWEPPSEIGGETDPTTALILLGFIGLVIASSQMGSSRIKAEAIPEEFAEKDE